MFGFLNIFSSSKTIYYSQIPYLANPRNVSRNANPQPPMNKLLTVFILLPLFCVGQKQGNIWYFGNHAGLDFNSGSAIPLTDGQTYPYDATPIEGTAVISDSSGALLFYTNGMKIWNKNHQVMPNGNGILSSFSSTQSALIVPQPGSSRYFYVFTTDDFYLHELEYGFRYSIVDICLDSGLGDVMVNQKNILLLDTVAEKLTAIRHANGLDYWIIVHKFFSDAFYSYHLSTSGIINTVISHVGSFHPLQTALQDNWASIGYLKASPDGSKIAIVNANTGPHAIAEYFDFDKNTGIVSNWINLQTQSNFQNNYQYYGISFSPDNSKLYITHCLNQNGIYQFDLNAGNGNRDSVIASKTRITGQEWSWSLQLATDGKIYSTSQGQYLSVINNPNNAGIACNFIDSAIYLNTGITSIGLPNFIDSYDYSNATYNCATTGINDEDLIDKVSAFPNPFTTQTTLQTDKVLNDATLTLYNSLGQQARQVNNINGQTVTLHRDNLPSGLYYLQLTQDNQTIATDKLVITD